MNLLSVFGKTKEKILVTNSEEFVYRSIKALMGDYEVISCMNAIGLLERDRDSKILLVVVELDPIREIQTGEYARRIKESFQIPVILLSTFCDKKHLSREAKLCGLDHIFALGEKIPLEEKIRAALLKPVK